MDSPVFPAKEESQGSQTDPHQRDREEEAQEPVVELWPPEDEECGIELSPAIHSVTVDEEMRNMPSPAEGDVLSDGDKATPVMRAMRMISGITTNEPSVGPQDEEAPESLLDPAEEDEMDTEAESQRKFEPLRRWVPCVLAFGVAAVTFLTRGWRLADGDWDEWLLISRASCVVIGASSMALLGDGLRIAFLSAIFLLPHAPSRFPRLISALDCNKSIFLLTWAAATVLFWDSLSVGTHLPGKAEAAAMLRRVAVSVTVNSCVIFLKSIFLNIHKHRNQSQTLDDKMIDTLMSQIIFTRICAAEYPSLAKTLESNLPLPPLMVSSLFVRHKERRRHLRKPLKSGERQALGAAVRYIQKTLLPAPPALTRLGPRARWISSRDEAVLVARETFSQLFSQKEKDKGARVLTREDLRSVIREDEVLDCIFDMFDRDGVGRISLREWRDGFVQAYRDRRGLSLTFRDTKTASRLIDSLVTTSLVIVLAGLNLLYLGVSIVNVVVPFTSFVVAFSFIFGNALRTYFESVTFLLAMHPFDTGDTILVDGTKFKVHQMFVLSTVLQKWDGQMYIFPNSVLMKTPIINARRSKPVIEEIKLMVPIETPVPTLLELRNDLLDFIRQEKQDWETTLDFQFEGISPEKNSLGLMIYATPRTNWHYGDRWGRLHRLYVVVMGLLRKYKIRYAMPPQPMIKADEPEMLNLGSYSTAGPPISSERFSSSFPPFSLFQ